MDKYQLFSLLLGRDISDEERVAKILKYRGFLLEKDDNYYVLSDNSHAQDEKYLIEIVNRFGIGEYNNHKLYIVNNDYKSLIDGLFVDNGQIPSNEYHKNLGWLHFRNRRCGYKAPVKILESYISYYVKAISACGVTITGSCDGNHVDKHEAFLQTAYPGTRVWHRYLWDEVIPNDYSCDLSNNGMGFLFGTCKYETYYNLMRAADYLYDNRVNLRKLKRKSFTGMTQRFLKEASDEEIACIMLNNARIYKNETLEQ